MLNVDEIAKLIVEKWELLAAIAAILSGTGIAGIAGLVKWQTNRRQRSRLRQIPRGDFPFEVIKPGSSDLLKQIMGGDDSNPLADCIRRHASAYRRRQNLYAKNLAGLQRVLAVQRLVHNWVRPHWGLAKGTTPAMAMGYCNRRPSIEELLTVRGFSSLIS